MTHTTTSIEYIGTTTVATVSEKTETKAGLHVEQKTGVAYLNPRDKFSAYEGARIALARAYGEDPFPDQENEELPYEVRDVGRYSVGDRVIIAGNCGSSGCAGLPAKVLRRTSDSYEVETFSPFTGAIVTQSIDEEDLLEDQLDLHEVMTPCAGDWVACNKGELPPEGAVIRVTNPQVVCGYNTGSVGIVLRQGTTGVRAKFRHFDDAFLWREEFEYWKPKEVEPSWQKKTKFRVGDLVRLTGWVFDPAFRNRTGRILGIDGDFEFEIGVLGRRGKVVDTQVCYVDHADEEMILVRRHKEANDD